MKEQSPSTLQNSHAEPSRSTIPIRTYEEWQSDLEKIPEAEQILWVRETLRPKSMLPIFGRYFFPHIIKGMDPVPECHISLCNEIGKREDGAVIFPRGFSKSTWIKLDTIHDIVYQLEPVILYIGNTITDAQFHFEAIKNELENNHVLAAIFGWLFPDPKDLGRKWTNKHLQTTTGINLVARGAGKGRGVNIKNQRPTKIICDDIEDDEQVASPDRCIKLHNWLYDVIFPSKDAKRGFIKMIGTVLAKHAEILKFYNQHGGIFRKAIEGGQSIWKNYWTMDRLEKQRVKIGTRAFSKEYMNNPVDESTAIIKQNWIMDRLFYELPQGKNKFMKVIMMDPQSGEKEGSDFYGLAVLGWYNGDIHRYFLQIMKGRATQLQQAALLVKIWQQNPEAIHVGVEKVMTQVAVYQLIVDWKAGRIDLEGVDNKNRNIPIRPVTPEGKDKKARLQRHEAAFERGEVHVHHTMRNFIDNLTAFPYVEHDDDVDAAIYCLDWSYKSSFTPVDQSVYNSPDNKSIVGDIYRTQF